VSIPGEFVFEVRAEVDPPLVIGPSSHGLRRVVPILGGSVRGPRLNGRVVPGGADWQYVRPDGVLSAEARYALEADDGTLVMVTNRGLRHGPADVIERLGRGEPVAPEAYYFRTAAEFEAPLGPHDWLNKAIFVGIAAREARAAIIRFHRVT
jgi:Protein of unknown function (DUF3237)